MFNGAKNLVITGGTFTHYNVESSGLEILHKQTSPSAFHNSGERFDPPKCHPNTRVAVLNRIMDWVLAVASFDALIMWLYGPAGAGKSAIAQTIAEQCFERELLLASFFFSRNDHNRNRSKPLIATLAYQAALTVPDARTHIESAVKKDPAIFERSLEAQLEALIFDPLRQLCDAGFFNSPNFPRLVIIDGLDECGEAQMQCNILRSIANVVNKQRLPIIFLICSRPEQHISIEFNTGILDTITTRIVLDDTFLPEDDIRLFLKDSCETIKATHPLLPKFIGRIKTLPFSDAEHLCAHNITILDEYLKTAFVEYASDPRLIASLAFTDPILGSACAETEAMYLQQNLLNFDKQLEDFDIHAIGLYSLCLEPHLMGLGPILYRDLLYQFLSDPSKAGDLYLSPAKYSLSAEYVLRNLTNSAINHAGSVMGGLNMLPKLLSKADRSDELLQLTTKDEWQECCSQFSERWQSSKEAISAYVSRCNGLF